MTWHDCFFFQFVISLIIFRSLDNAVLCKSCPWKSLVFFFINKKRSLVFFSTISHHPAKKKVWKVYFVWHHILTSDINVVFSPDDSQRRGKDFSGFLEVRQTSPLAGGGCCATDDPQQVDSVNPPISTPQTSTSPQPSPLLISSVKCILITLVSISCPFHPCHTIYFPLCTHCFLTKNLLNSFISVLSLCWSTEP